MAAARFLIRRRFKYLLALVIVLSVLAMKGNAEIGHSSVAAASVPAAWNEFRATMPRQFAADTSSSLGQLVCDAYYSIGYALVYPVSAQSAQRWYGGSAQRFAGAVVGTGQMIYDVAALASYGLVSAVAPEAAYNAYGGAIERLEQRLPVFYGGSGQSAAYQVTYGTLSAATVFIGTEFGQAGRVGRAAVWTTESRLAAEVAQQTAPITNPSRLLTAGTDVPNAGGVIRSFAQEGDQIYYRVFSESQQGRFLTAVPPRSSAFAREALALPPGNRATFIQQVLVPHGTILQRSRALPAFGARGGAEQFELLQRIPAENFGLGTPLL